MIFNKKHLTISFFLALFTVLYFLSCNYVNAAASPLGASMYIAPLSENPRANSNFTATVKVDSLAQPVNAAKGTLYFDKDKLEIINISKIGSILNLWVEEPTFSNIEGTLKFQGGVPNPGFIGNGGVIFHIIFRAKGPGVNSLAWKEGEILASDGKGTNILTNLQNLDFFVEESLIAGVTANSSDNNGNGAANPLPPWAKILIYSNIALIVIVLIIIAYLLIEMILRVHDKRLHREEIIREYENHHVEQNRDQQNHEFFKQ